MDAIVAAVVDGIAINLLRIQRLGIRHIMVANIAPGACMPYSTLPVNNSTACIANDTINTQTMLHNSLLEDRVKLLNRLGLHGADIIIVNMTKAFQELFYSGEKYGEASCDDCYIWSIIEHICDQNYYNGPCNSYSHCYPTLLVNLFTSLTHRRD